MNPDDYGNSIVQDLPANDDHHRTTDRRRSSGGMTIKENGEANQITTVATVS